MPNDYYLAHYEKVYELIYSPSGIDALIANI